LLAANATVNPVDPAENPPLLPALIGGHAEVADMLASKGAEIKNEESAEQALLACSMCPDGMMALQLLIEYGVSPNCTNFLGECSLHIATTAGLPDIMKFLMKVGVDVNARDSMYTFHLLPDVVILTWRLIRCKTDTTHESLQQPKLQSRMDLDHCRSKSCS
jgi:ankyrin repeat protein